MKNRLKFFRSLTAQSLLGILAVFILILLSGIYILLSSRSLEAAQDKFFEEQTFISSLQDTLASCNKSLLTYLSANSSNALAELLMNGQNLRNALPHPSPPRSNAASLRLREIYSLVRSWLDIADEAVRDKRGRNIEAYTQTYTRLQTLYELITREIAQANNESFSASRADYQLFIRQAGRIQGYNFLFMLSVATLSLLLLYLSINHSLDPLRKLAAMAGEISNGHFDIDDIKVKSADEINMVVDAFNSMKNEMRNFMEELRVQENIKADYVQEKLRNMRMQSLVHRAQVYALQAQMNPHFLFNTINTGMQLAIVEGADRTSEYMDSMAQLFRHIIRNKETFVPLRYEIEGMDYYFKILRVRFPRDLDLVLDCPEELLDACTVPVSILQPLVENCIVHAFKNTDGAKRGGGVLMRKLISVRVEKHDALLVLTVRDNGDGMDAATRDKLLTPNEDEQVDLRVMGLENVIQRLYFFYPGDSDIIRIEAENGKGTAVIITLDRGRKPCTGS
jgi:sensor histidine kinase YesM